ncbi:MAG: hypothetical protein WBP03_02215 [Candidatus Saccharimonadales bacterium]
MSSDFLKREIEAEAKEATKNKAITIVTVATIIVLGVFGFGYWYSHRANPSVQRPALSVDQSKAKEKTNDIASKPTDTSTPNTPSQSNATGSQQSPAQQTSTSSYQYSPTTISKSAFIASSNQVMASYSQIVALVTFAPSDSDDAKADRIKQAVSLDRQAFSSATSLHSQLVSAELSSGPYVDATNLAESGVSKISVGLTFMNYWANDRSRASDLQSGLGGVNEGSNILLTFSQKLNAL